MATESKNRDLWALQYGSKAYDKVNQWTQFLLTRSVDPKKLREGQALLIETQEHTPHKWTLIFSQQDDQWKKTFAELKKTISGLDCSQISFFSPSEEQIFNVKQVFRDEIMKKKFTAHKEDSF